MKPRIFKKGSTEKNKKKFTNMSLIELENVGLSIEKGKILRDISLKIGQNEIITLVGPNGGGKTSLARIILGILQPTNGKIFRKKNLQMSYMPQKIKFDSAVPLSAIDFIGLTANKKLQKELIFLAKRLKIDQVLHKQFADLSGGQQQKVSFLRSVLIECDLLVLDEPTQYMDIAGIDEFYQIIQEVKMQRGCSILLISHDLHIVMQKTDFVFCINHHVCCHGRPKQVDQHPEFLELFGDKIAKNNSRKIETNGIALYHHNHDHQHESS